MPFVERACNRQEIGKVYHEGAEAERGIEFVDPGGRLFRLSVPAV
jgi:hypothetical protein